MTGATSYRSASYPVSYPHQANQTRSYSYMGGLNSPQPTTEAARTETQTEAIPTGARNPPRTAANPVQSEAHSVASVISNVDWATHGTRQFHSLSILPTEQGAGAQRTKDDAVLQ